MFKQNALATIAVFVTWTIIDILVHGNLLVETYLSTPHLWRPEAEMNSLLMFAVTAVYGFFLWRYISTSYSPNLCRKGLSSVRFLVLQ